MRPSRRLLLLSALCLAGGLLILAAGLPPEGAAVAVAALTLAAMADLALTPGRGAVALEVGTPADTFCGEIARLPARLQATRGVLPPIAEARAEFHADLGGQTTFGFAPAGTAAAVATIAIPARKRGVFDISAIWLRWASRLGLWEVTPRLPIERQLRVVPNIRPIAAGTVDTAVRSELYGVKDTIARGEGSEFHQLVEFTAGMDYRAIDWKRSARHRNLVAKEMRAERNHQIILALDNGYLMRGQIDGVARVDHAINAALVVAWAAGLGGDLVGLYSFDAQPRLYTPPQPARAAFPRLRRQMADMDYSSVEANHTLALAHLNGLLKRRSLIVMFSDFADTTTAELMMENIGVLNRAHVVVFVTLSDPTLAARQRATAADPQAVAEAVVAAQMQRERNLVLDRLTRMGVFCLETGPGQLSPRLLSAYLDIKAKELI
ncbi:MAG: DUF58 domain-containing protein [Pseudomonadota bacterium]